MSKVVITGATGTIGASVAARCLRAATSPWPCHATRIAPVARFQPAWRLARWEDPTTELPPLSALEQADAVINLLGEPIAQRWTPAVKQRIADSRAAATRMLVTGLRELSGASRPGVLVSQSASGYYGSSGQAEVDEEARPGNGYLAGVVQAWEAAALSADDLVRVTTTRTGVVLSASGGALTTMLPFFRLGIGGPVAGGRQYVPWVHIDDATAALLFCLDDPRASGPINVASPNPVNNAELSQALGRVLHRPAFMPVPAFALRLLYGEMAEIVTGGQRLIPRRLLELGFEFRHPTVEPALRDVLG